MVTLILVICLGLSCEEHDMEMPPVQCQELQGFYAQLLLAQHPGWRLERSHCEAGRPT